MAGRLLQFRCRARPKRVPKMEKRIFVEADVDEHRLQTHLDVFNAAFVNAAYDLREPLRSTLYSSRRPFSSNGHAALEFLHTDYQFVAGLA